MKSSEFFDINNKFTGSDTLPDIPCNRIEKALELSNSYNHSLIESSLDPLIIMGSDGKIIDVNNATEQTTGYSKIDLIGTDFSDYFIEPEKVRKCHQQACIYGKVWNYYLEIKHKDGHATPVLYNASVYKNESEVVIYIFATARNITERKKAEEALKKVYENLGKLVEERTIQLEKAYKSLKESQESLAEAQKMAHIGNWEWDVAANKAHWSDEMYRIFGINPQECAPEFENFFNYIHPEDRHCIDKIVKKKPKGRFDGIDYRIILNNGEQHTVFTQSEAIFNEENIPIRVKGVVQDITERKKAEEKLRESEEKYRNIVETANEGIIIIDDKFKVTFANHKMTEMFGYDVEESIGRSLWDFMDDRASDVVEKNMEKWAYGIIETYEIELTCKDGSTLWAMVNSKPLFDGNGRSIGVLAMLTDINERKKAEEKLRESEEKYRNIIETTNEGIVVIDSELKITYINKKLLEKGGYLPEEVIGRLWLDFTDEEGKIVAQQHMNKRRQGIDETYELKLMRKDGSPFWVLVSSKSLHDKDGKFAGSLSMLTDITERKKAEEKIKSLAKIVESSNDAIITTSPDGIIESWNKGAEQIYGYLAEEVLGKNISILEPNSCKGEIKYLTNEIRQGKKIQSYETSRLKKDCTVITVSVTLSPIFDQSGRFIAVSCIAGDITEKKMTEKLLQEKQMAEVANSTKNDFLASISHELRTPLNSIIGFSDMLYEQAYGNMTEKQLSSIKNISQSGKHLLNLINNILDISKIEAGKMELVYKDFELIIKLNMIRNILYPIASKKNIKIDIDVDSSLTTICADEEKFVQIMYNLVDNAIKFSYESSPVKIAARKKGDMVEITVRDTGIGIKAEDHCKLFKPFSQIHSSSPRKTQGTGLGLSLVKQIVHLHGGYVWFRSNPGSGSIFAFVIPINCQLSRRAVG
jgi:PAS domain S-box-containing protein